jgi:endogenous inhibitor of DNA gyrase (YacG/DUF329 family)
VGSGQWAVGSGQWAVGSGQWAVGRKNSVQRRRCQDKNENIMIVKCPKCGKDVETEGNKFRPFCSERCKLLDLGNWLSGHYGIPEENDTTAQSDESLIQKDAEVE